VTEGIYELRLASNSKKHAAKAAIEKRHDWLITQHLRLASVAQIDIQMTSKSGLGAYLHHRSKAVVCMAHFLPPLTYLQ